MSEIRVGHGYDVHKFAEGRRLVLGGVDIPHDRGLLGHSDADVLTHAVMDALLGGAGLPDIGRCFPDTDPAYAGADSIALETFMDLEMLRIAVEAAKPFGLPLMCSMTFEKRQRTMMGDTIEKICASMEEAGAMAVGMNCSYGPVKALEIIKSFSEKTSLPLYYKPNAGMGEDYSAEQFAREVEPALELVSFVGGCCGCDESYIKELGKLL